MIKKPDMNCIEEYIKIFERLSASQSQEMVDYIYHLEKCYNEYKKEVEKEKLELIKAIISISYIVHNCHTFNSCRIDWSSIDKLIEKYRGE